MRGREATHASPSSMSASSSPPARAKSSSSMSPVDIVKQVVDESAGLSGNFGGVVMRIRGREVEGE